MSKKAFFFLQTPLQIMCAKEAIDYFHINEPHLVIRYSGLKNNDCQMHLLLNLLELKNFVIYEETVSGKSIRDISYLFQSLKVISFFKSLNYKSYDLIFLPEYYSGLVRLLDRLVFNKFKEKIFLLDDGVATLYIQKKLFSNKFNRNLFTFFKNLRTYKNQKIVTHSFNSIKDFIFFHRKNEMIDIDTSIILGQAFFESNIISKEDYIMLIGKLINNLPGENYIYIPHRREDRSKLRILKDKYNIKIKEIFYPIEFYSYFELTIPKQFISFVSTALFTLKYIYSDSEIISFNINIPIKERSENLKLTYEKIKDENIPIINL